MLILSNFVIKNETPNYIPHKVILSYFSIFVGHYGLDFVGPAVEQQTETLNS